MNNRKLLLIGGGGHCKSVIEVLEEENVYHAIGIIDRSDKRDTLLFDYPVIGSDEDLETLYLEGYKEAFVTIGSIGDSSKRIAIYKRLTDIGFTVPNIISKTALISNRLVIGKGNFVGKGVIINTSVTIGDNNILNTGSIIEHDCLILDNSHIAPGVTLSGGVKIGSESHVGTNATVNQYLSIGSNTIVGAGSVVVKNIGNNVIAYGVPCDERAIK